MSAVKCLSEVIETKCLTTDVKEVSLRMIDPPSLEFRAGQYIAIEVTETKDGHQRLNNRPYSIVSPPEESEVIRLCVNLVPGGPGSTYLHGLQVGEKVPFLYPLGYFIVKDQTAPSFLFIATGTGIAPIKSMIVHLLREGIQRPMKLLWGLRKEEGCYYQHEILELARRHPTLKYVLTLSQPSPSWKGPRGRVTHCLDAQIHGMAHFESYLCGNGAMIREVRSTLLAKGLPRKSIHFEKFYD